MAKLTDEMLMAFADGQLNALTRAKVEATLQGSPGARRRLAIFRATGAPLAKLYEQPMAEPVPQHLIDFVMNHRPPAPVLKAGRSEEDVAQSLKWFARKARMLAAGVAGWLDAPAPRTVRWQLAAASLAVLAIGAGAGFSLRDGAGSQDGLVAFDDGRIFASGALLRVLETAPSGQDSRIGGVRGEAVTMRAALTFKSTQQTYCREYEIETPANGGFAGLGCRERDGRWAIEVNIRTGGAANGIKTAGRERVALDTMVDRLMEGIAFGPKEEAAAISSGWK